MNIVVFGASGGCGRLAVLEGVHRGHRVLAVVRPGAAAGDLERAGAQVRRCDPYQEDLSSVVAEGTDAVISCIGMRRRTAWNPWSSLASPRDTAQRCTLNTISAMQRVGVPRVACISAAGVGESRQQCSLAIRCLIRFTNLSPAYSDLARMEQELQRSGLAWLAIRPTTLTNATHPRSLHPVNRYTVFRKSPRVAVANMMLDFAECRPGALSGAVMRSG